jgi:hypothetical protein
MQIKIFKRYMNKKPSRFNISLSAEEMLMLSYMAYRYSLSNEHKITNPAQKNITDKIIGKLQEAFELL